MPTKLNKVLRRDTGVPLDWRNRNIIIEIHPEGVLTFREKGRRRRFTLPIRSAFNYAIAIEYEARKREKEKEKEKKIRHIVKRK